MLVCPALVHQCMGFGKVAVVGVVPRSDSQSCMKEGGILGRHWEEVAVWVVTISLEKDEVATDPFVDWLRC